MNRIMKQKQNKPQEIEKSGLYKIIEFFHAIRIIQDCRKLIDNGKAYQIIPIYGQLRSLLTDSTKVRNKELKPLFEIASLLKLELPIYYVPNNLEKEMPSLSEGMVLHVSSTPISLHQKWPMQKKILLEDYLNLEILKYRGQSYKTFEIINALSNKSGGSHYDTNLPKYINDLASFNIDNQPVLENLIIQISDLVIDIALILLKKISDFEYFIVLQTKSLSNDQNFIFDCTLPHSTSRISLYCFQGKIRFFIRDLVGKFIDLETSENENTINPYLINISMKITTDLKTEIKIGKNGISILDKVIDEPLLMLNELYYYQVYYNRSYEKEFQDFEFGIGEILMYRTVHNDRDRAKIFTYYLDKKPKKYKELVWFNKNTYGQTPPGERDIKLVGFIEEKK